MPAAATSPTVLRWELAARLRALRVAAEKSIEDAAKELMCSPAKISRMETAGRGILARDVRDLCRFYGVDDDLRDELIRMAADSKKPGWWADYRSLDEQTTTFLGLESAASAIHTLESRAVPGVLQTEAYTRLLLEGIVVPALSPADIDEMAAVRQRRRESIVSRAVSFSAVIDESVLIRDFGQTEIMREQLELLITCADLPTFSLQIVLFDGKPYPGIEGSFQHLAFADRSVADLVYVEGILSNFIVDRAADVKRYLAVYEQSLASALTPEESLRWMKDRMSTYGHKPQVRSRKPRTAS